MRVTSPLSWIMARHSTKRNNVDIQACVTSLPIIVPTYGRCALLRLTPLAVIDEDSRVLEMGLVR